MKKILVTGARGQLGLTIEKLFGATPLIQFLFCNSNELDIREKWQIQKVFTDFKPDYCINCAAYTAVDKAQSEPLKAYSINAEGVKNLALACNRHNTILIHISTDYVFDGFKNRPYTVKDEPNPINEYGKSKLQGERYIQEILNNYFIIRTSWLYSKEFGINFYRTILEKAKNEKHLFVTDAQIGCPTNCETLARFIFELIDNNNKKYGIHHFCDGESMTWFVFAKKILKENGLEERVIVIKDNSYKTIAQRPKNSVLSISN